ncbi:MAG: universal stress protein [Agriterribacter sp.]
MAATFTSILIPVDFSINTDIALEKALSLCHAHSCIHLLHVQQIPLGSLGTRLMQYVNGYSVSELYRKREKLVHALNEMRINVLEQHPTVRICTWIGFGQKVEDAIIRQARRVYADLVVIGKRSNHSFLPFLNKVSPAKVASKSGVAVLTAKPGSLHSAIKTIVIPVGNKFPSVKLEHLEAMRKKSSVRVRLVSFLNGASEPAGKQSMINTFRTLKNFANLPVECDVLAGNNKSRELLHYCERVGANLLIVNPDTDTNRGGLIKRSIADMLPASSAMQVLTVRPQF